MDDWIARSMELGQSERFSFEARDAGVLSPAVVELLLEGVDLRYAIKA